MKVCKKCKLSVNVDVVTCPECGEHDFKLDKLKICQLCGFVNKEANLYCDRCGKNFKEDPSEYAIATAVSLYEGGGSENASRPDSPQNENAADNTHSDTPQKLSMQERYLELKPEIEKGDYLNKYAYFIPTLSAKEKPMVVLPSFLDQADKNVEVYFVLPTPSDPDQLQMARAEITAEQDIDKESKGRYFKVWKKVRKISYSSLFVFLLSFAMLFAFGFKFLGEVTGLQILAGYFVDNNGTVVLKFLESKDTAGQILSYIYLVSAGLIFLSLFFSAIFMISRKSKGKKVLLILTQALVFLSAVGVYLMAPLFFEAEYAHFDDVGVIILLSIALVSFVISFFYKVEKGAKKEPKAPKEPKVKSVKATKPAKASAPIAAEPDDIEQADRFEEERRRREVGGNDFNRDADFDLPHDY